MNKVGEAGKATPNESVSAQTKVNETKPTSSVPAKDGGSVATLTKHTCQESKSIYFDSKLGHYVGGSELCGRPATQKDWSDKWICDECYERKCFREFDGPHSDWTQWRATLHDSHDMEHEDVVKADPELTGLWIEYDAQFDSGWIKKKNDAAARTLKEWYDAGKSENEIMQLWSEFMRVDRTPSSGPDLTPETTIDFGFKCGSRIKKRTL